MTGLSQPVLAIVLHVIPPLQHANTTLLSLHTALLHKHMSFALALLLDHLVLQQQQHTLIVIAICEIR